MPERAGEENSPTPTRSSLHTLEAERFLAGVGNPHWRCNSFQETLPENLGFMNEWQCYSGLPILAEAGFEWIDVESTKTLTSDESVTLSYLMPSS